MSYIKHIKKIFLKKNIMPSLLTFFITNKCNAKCRHCFYWRELDKKKEILSLSEINKISEKMSDLMVLVLGGGEPFLRKEIVDIVKIFYKNNHIESLVIPTNGLATDIILERVEEIAKDCKKIRSITIYISIDEIGKLHDSLRGVKGIFNSAVKTYEGLSILKKKYKNLNLGILLTVNPDNQNRILKIYNYIKEKIHPEFISPLLMRSTSKNMNSADVKIENYDKLIEAVKQDILKGEFNIKDNSLYANLKTRLLLKKMDIISKTAKKGYQTPCYAGTISAVMYEDGNVFPCEILNKKIGNIRDFNYNFKKLWLSPNSKKIRKFIRDSKCFCTYECAVDCNIAFNFLLMGKIILKGIYSPKKLS